MLIHDGLVRGFDPARRKLSFNSPTYENGDITFADANSPTGLGGTTAGAGSGTGAGMGAGTAFGALSLVSTLFGAFAQHQAGKVQKQITERNARIATYEANDAVERGDIAATRRLTQSRQIQGSQRVALASQGVDVNSGSAADVQADTAMIGALDAVTIQNNAARQAWGYQVQAQDYSLRGDYAQMTGDNQALSTILTGGSNLLLARSGFGRSQLSDNPLFTRP